MINNTNKYLLFFFFGIFFSITLVAQNEDTPDDDLGNVSDAFQEYFFEALKQKGIENYELAIIALKKAETAAKDNVQNKAVVYFETGKNHLALKQYDEAELSFLKVKDLQIDRIEVTEALYDLYYETRNYEKAILTVQELIKYDSDYKEDLANLYLRTKQYEKALSILDELDLEFGVSTYRENMRDQIYRVTNNKGEQINRLEGKVANNPKNEKDWLNLIYLYSDEGNATKAFETAKRLLKNLPQSELVHLALYKFYLEENNAQEALKSMKITIESETIESESKFKVLGDFLQFVNNNPSYENQLQDMITLFSNKDENSKVYEQLGDYYVKKSNNEEALKYYALAVKLDSDNFLLIKNTLLLQIDFNKNEDAIKLINSSLEVFPSQPIFYLMQGVILQRLDKPIDAIEALETGMDYLIDDTVMERDFYEQLSKAYETTKNNKKAEQYAKKARDLSMKS